MLEEKIKTRQELVDICSQLKSQSKKIGYTSGVFDLLHHGHVDYLHKAKAKCDVLIVGLNSDLSVKQNKGDKRPICAQAQRAAVLAGLACVDFVFIFDEKNNNQNIELLKPDLYLKAGDYDKSKLSSAPLIESYGGKVEIIPFLNGFSTTSIIEKIAADFSEDSPRSISLALPEKRPAIFVDRDGTLNEEIEYLHEVEKFKLYPRVIGALKSLQDAGFRIVVITNQAGIGLGYFSKEDFYKVNKELLKAARKENLSIDRVYFCPHAVSDNCDCRKPNTGMIYRGVEELNIDLENSYCIGDKTLDLEAARRAGCKSILVQTGHAGGDKEFDIKADYTAKDLSDAASWILSQPKNFNFNNKASQPASSLEAIGKLSAKLGHDFNNIFGAVQGCIDLLDHKYSQLNPEQKAKFNCEKQFKIIRSALAKGVSLTSKIRGFVRPGPLTASAFRLRDTVEQVVEVLKKSETLSFEIELSLNSDSQAYIDEMLVSQMLINICANAIEAMSKVPDRHLILFLSDIDLAQAKADLKAGKYVCLSIVDHGKGIKKDKQEKLLEPFFTTKQNEVGKALGLSLAMAAETMRKHSGSLQIASEPDIGTVVHLYFPRL